MKNHKEFGAEGEIFALEYLEKIGYSLRHKNYRIRHGELDLILDTPDGTIVFCEVKCDRSGSAGTPESWVNKKKIRQIQKTAQAYCCEFGLKSQSMRFDVVSVTMKGTEKQIRHIPNAFLPDSVNYY